MEKSFNNNQESSTQTPRQLYNKINNQKQNEINEANNNSSDITWVYMNEIQTFGNEKLENTNKMDNENEGNKTPNDSTKGWI